MHNGRYSITEAVGRKDASALGARPQHTAFMEECMYINHNQMAQNVGNTLTSHYGNLQTSTTRLSTACGSIPRLTTLRVSPSAN